ncbi:Peptidyl-prolyl isomerase CWC27 [Cercospora beticola]|uniref:Peptidyl-prolyl isomerase CWC27 n=1 Tax=Cercospora beticola TaxID=122368 RepID=A0A2G5HIC9_CERBT|nr:Peptidyl-prolyl isomerase CWC27 [Cercospora beticola]PIA92289.1 Peptidyl-prolyl isomerase CWC27 [Cercospora beticola]WPB06372.1 hypothetical protein RHO25_011029 [Cercospora beticola]
MAALYNLEPQPTAKVILNTTSGDLQLEIFAKQCPLAARNFLQHCLDGYYNNTVFHRLVPGFIVQGGDPTGTGSGGISAINNGDAFEDEFHTRLKFNRRGLLGMANEGPNTNGSQFFFTLGATPELQAKNTMFGRIEGDTIYNLMKMADTELVGLEEGSERPMYPTRITGAEVLVNPFEDMVARVKEAPRSKDEGKKDTKKRKKPLGKQVLSFGDDEEDAAPVMKKVKANPKLVVVEEEAQEKPVEKAPKQKKEKLSRQDQPMPDAVEVAASEKLGASRTKEGAEEEDDEESEDDAEAKRQKKLDSTNAEIAALKASLKRTVDTGPKQKEKPKSALESMIPTTSIRGRKRGKATDERGALDLFKKFKSRLEDLPDDETSATTTNGDAEAANGEAVAPTAADAEDDEAALCDLHFIANCESCRKWDEEQLDGDAEDDGEEDMSWMAKKLTFAKDTKGKDLEWKRKMEEIEVIDPRAKAQELKMERRKGKSERKLAEEDRVRSKR